MEVLTRGQTPSCYIFSNAKIICKFYFSVEQFSVFINLKVFKLVMYKTYKTNVKVYSPPCAKQTFNFGNFSSTPPNIIEQIATDVSDGIPENIIKHYQSFVQNSL